MIPLFFYFYIEASPILTEDDEGHVPNCLLKMFNFLIMKSNRCSLQKIWKYIKKENFSYQKYSPPTAQITTDNTVANSFPQLGPVQRGQIKLQTENALYRLFCNLSSPHVSPHFLKNLKYQKGECVPSILECCQTPLLMTSGFLRQGFIQQRRFIKRKLRPERGGHTQARQPVITQKFLPLQIPKDIVVELLYPQSYYPWNYCQNSFPISHSFIPNQEGVIRGA